MLCSVERRGTSVGVVVLAHEGATVLGATLAALPGEIDLVVVDNASTDGSADVAETAAPGARVLRRPGNDGYGAGMNAGAEALRQAPPDYMLFLTQECVLGEGALSRLVQVLESSPELQIVGPVLRLHGSDTLWSAGGELTGRRLAARHRTGTAGDVVPVAWLDGAALLARSSAFFGAGGFRESFFLYWEDVELCLRLGGCACVTSATAWQSTSLTPPYLASRNRVVYLRETSRLGLVSALAEIVCRAGSYVLQGRWRAARLHVAGAVDGLRGSLRRELALERPS
ncbi:MAG: glycosyl transferase family 2 [Frankiales bacterium]|nr:glycosyl transferase family 2 [Frankiales bacterium]